MADFSFLSRDFHEGPLDKGVSILDVPVYLYPLPAGLVERAELSGCTTFPEPLKELWSELGIGWIMRSQENEEDDAWESAVNRIMTPGTAMNVRCTGSKIPGFPGIEPELFDSGAFPFWELGDDNYHCVADDGAVITVLGQVLAPSIEDFLRRVYLEDSLFWRDM